MELITPYLKDRLLTYLLNNCVPEQLISVKPNAILNELAMTFDTFNAIMVQFQRIGFVEELNLRRVAIQFILSVEAHDFAIRGGFVAQEELIEKNLNKLLLEIENLKKDLGPQKLETLNKLAGIASGIIAGIGLFRK
jgi:hypothetical protein